MEQSTYVTFSKTSIQARELIHQFLSRYPSNYDAAILKLLLSFITIFIFVLVKEVFQITFNNF